MLKDHIHIIHEENRGIGHSKWHHLMMLIASG